MYLYNPLVNRMKVENNRELQEKKKHIYIIIIQQQCSSDWKQNITTIRTQQSETVNPITKNWESLPGCKVVAHTNAHKHTYCRKTTQYMRVNTNTYCISLQFTGTQMHLQTEKIHQQLRIYITCHPHVCSVSPSLSASPILFSNIHHWEC